ncbi:neuropilin-2-like isoform X2 [Chiloscyllium plagiosum]|uniref:neuropilin-2-like isoform X2 n=1 Tax=Chiloscyllium plagiosum TaxID=36176 RepID=UPI001CB7B53E|nr:neuropilin-2-like isoform X2 [Chiloscyllium plagiosum]
MLDRMESPAALWVIWCLFTLGAGENGEAQCGERLNAGEAGYITSPGYPQDYMAHQTCEWVIYAPENHQKILLNFNPHFELEKHDCRYDYIEIRDGDAESADLLGKHCGNIAPSSIISSGSSLYIKFVSDYAHQGAGFSLRYEIYRTGSDDCSKNFSAPSGTIESPSFPDKYPHNLYCTYIIQAPPRSEVILTMLTFDLEYDPLQIAPTDCRYDRLDVWDGLPEVSPLIGRYCGSKIPAVIRSDTGIMSLTFHTDMAVAKDGFSAVYNITTKDTADSYQCNSPLGMESGQISNMQITASSSYTFGNWDATQGRLNYQVNGWTPNEDTVREWIQVDLGILKIVTGIATQGAISVDTAKIYFVSTYKLEVSSNGEDWMVYRQGKNHKLFPANTDGNEVVLNTLTPPVLARFVRIRPQIWKNGISMRFELYGCQITNAPCSDMLGMLSGIIPDSQITASSTRDYHWSPGSARLIASRSGWYPRQPHPPPGTEWLQVALPTPKTVSAIIIQGARGASVMDGGTGGENKAFVRKFKLAYSMNGANWTFVKESGGSRHKMFEGNMNYDTPEIRRFDPVPARFVRVYPERWSPAGIGMRFELQGCDLMATTTSAATIASTQWVGENVTEAPCASGGDPSCVTIEIPTSIEGFNCSFGDSRDNELCGWTHDPSATFRWMVHSGSSKFEDVGLNQDHNTGKWNYLHIEATKMAEGQRARLLSPMVPPINSHRCMVFWYRMRGANVGTLRVLLRKKTNDVMLWSLRGDQGDKWKEGKIILPGYNVDYQVIIEGIAGSDASEDLAVDNIAIASHMSLDQCIQPISAFPGIHPTDIPTDVGSDLNAWRDRDSSTVLPADGMSVTPTSGKDKNWLYSLDPILVTIIVMSSVGVLLGAVCAGLLLYCTCSYAGLSSRSSTTLENYNFELYDGIKHKVKMNQQKCCSEA